RTAEGAERTPRGHAGAPGLDRRTDASAVRALHRARDAESYRARGHVPPARSASRPFHDEGRHRLPVARRRAGDHGSQHDRGARDPAASRAARDSVLPDDIKAVALDVMRHRLIVTYEAEAEEITPEIVIGRVLDNVAVP